MKSPGNGAADPEPGGRFTIESASSDVDHLLEQIRQTESAVSPLNEQLAALGEEIQSDIAIFRQHGLREAPWSLGPQARQEQFRRAIRGAFALLGGEPYLGLEQERVRQRVLADDRPKLSGEDKAARLADLKDALRRAMAHFELVVRSYEGTGGILPRRHVDGELFLLSDSDLREREAGR
jgi:hypothetical protein